MPEIVAYESEMDNVRNLVFEKNSHIIADVEKADPSYFKNPKYKTPEDVLQKKKKTCISHFCGTTERFIQEACIEHLVKNKGFILEDVVPCQDGFQILEELWFDGILKEIEDVAFNKIGLNVEFKVKEFDEACDIPITLVENIDIDSADWKEHFKILAPEFEKKHAKIINKAVFVKETDNEYLKKLMVNC